MSEKLKPCPFCGGDARVRTWTDACELFAVVKCTQCGAESNMADDGTKTKGENIADAVASWNKRAGRNETIEECAKVVDSLAYVDFASNSVIEDAVKSICALKDKP